MFSKKFLDKGFVFLGVGIVSFGNILTEIILNYFNIDIPQYNIYICLIVGILLIIIGLIMYYKESKENEISFLKRIILHLILKKEVDVKTMKCLSKIYIVLIN